MSGIVGFSNFSTDYLAREEKWRTVVKEMNDVQKYRGPDGEGFYLNSHCAMAHVQLAVSDLRAGQQPLRRAENGYVCTIVCDGQIYNAKVLKKKLQSEGVLFYTDSDAEVVLAGYMHHGIEYVKELNGNFSFAIWDGYQKKVLLFRDHLGVKPLFYHMQGDTLVFASQLKGILAYPKVQAQLDRDGLCEIFGLGPARTPGSGVLKEIKEVLPGHYLDYSGNRCKESVYWQLESRPHEDSYEKTVERTRYLVEDAVRLQMRADAPICAFLSGGVDSSLVTSICAKIMEKQGKQLDTFSFDFKDNDRNFQSNAFQPSQDRPWVEKMAACVHSNHQYLECDPNHLFAYLFRAVDARDLPCMGDVESSLLYFCEKVTGQNKVALTGECADEIFGGYPWFHKQECLNADCFPWSSDFSPRTMLLKEDVLEQLPLETYAKAAYQKSIAETPKLIGENHKEARRREIAYLNLKWFMATLLDRMDRTSMAAGLDARVPFADHRIVEYLWNVPWEMKCRNGIVKGLLRQAGEKYLPKDVLYRRKSPYPKTYDPVYEQLLKNSLREVLADANEPLCVFVDRKKVEAYMQTPADYQRPFYGQLMAGPQLMAYMLQINYWMKKYQVHMV